MTYKQHTEARPWVLAVDPDDDGPIVTLRDGWCFKDDPGCGVKGFNSYREACLNTLRADVYQTGADE
jgi:hypothetical protein